MALIDRLHDVPPCNPDDFMEFRVEGRRYGYVGPAFAKHLAAFSDVFVIDERSVTLSSALSTPAARTQGVAQCLRELCAAGHILGWRDELYPVAEGRNAEPVLLIERAAATRFGIRIYAVNVCGYRREKGELFIWVAKRALSKQTSPGKLDTIVSGGQPAGISLWDNMIKECGEEASIPYGIAAHARPAGGISFCTEQPEGVLDYFQFNYDLALPDSFVPQNTDGEVENFTLMNAEEVLHIIANSDDFAYDSAWVVIDFLVRHGVIDNDHPDYIALVNGLRAGGRSTA